MLSPEAKRQLHQLENELLIKEESKRHLVVRDQALTQDERTLRTTLLRAEQELDKNKAERTKLRQLLLETEEEIRRLHTHIKGIRL